ncbi:hypothetical protein HLRTI_003392 [Halorhabdus tiamatea SARL4B]|uniref:Uncharacterized protein n=1 Tax=Halorhabdus tiamatea SARL4B TaxID=1033806 RepID=F7PHF2_9EURY|nr:hypothetical protein [Halorhabdus tiamatea]ERJ04641.1 hypothetical protein HLRTI_003392 [Halorhabdus tiamatea SARL4B]CCQ35045.1 hypothetical protein HTIA_p2943 [Halorhabdus tiamatea SARL4B]
MTIEGGNAAIRNYHKHNDEHHVFEIQDGAWKITYVGEYEYADHYWARLPTGTGAFGMRSASS